MSALEIVKPDRSDRSRSAGPSWGSIGVFVGSVVAVVALAFMLTIGFLVADMREDLKVLQVRYERLNREYAVLLDRTGGERSARNENQGDRP